MTPELREKLLQPDEIAASSTQSPRLFIRVYVERIGEEYQCYLVGAIGRDTFFDPESFTVKDMSSEKSKNAIYYTKSLRKGYPLATLTHWIQEQPTQTVLD